MQRILITGGLGFIGSNLAERCIELGYDVTLISKSKSKIKNIKGLEDKIKLILMDIKNVKKEVKGFDSIFHFAGTTDNYNLLNNPQRDIDANCTGTIALLEACKKYNPNVRIIFGSTFFVNGNPEQLPVTPSSPCNPLSLYGATRLAGEHFCKIYNQVFDMNIVIARFTNVFGIREQNKNKKKAGFNYLISLAMEGKEISLYNNGDFIRDYIYIDDVVNACLTLSEKGETEKIYYVGRGEFTKFKDLIDIVMEETKSKSIIKSIEPPEFHKRVGIKDYVCDNTLLRNLGWKPKVSLKEGIKKTIGYYKKINNEKK